MADYIIPTGYIFEENAKLLATLATLENLSKQFNEKAADNTKVAKALQEAATALRTKQEENRKLRRDLGTARKLLDRAEGGKPAAGRLIEAIAGGDLSEVKSLLDKGADPNERGAYGFTPLMSAAFYGHTEIARLLIDRDADTEAKHYTGRTAMEFAKAYHRTGVVQLLEEVAARRLSKVSDPSAKPEGEKPAKGHLIKVIAESDLSQVKSSLDKGADLNERTDYGFTPLMAAAVLGHTEIARLLISRGADTEARDSGGRTAMDFAKSNNRAGVVQLLEEVAANRSAKPGLTVMIDGSGSMSHKSYTETAFPFLRSLEATWDLYNTGAKVSAFLWGDKSTLSSLEITKEAFDKVAKTRGLDSTEFGPVADYLKTNAVDKPQHLVVLSDGDLAGRNYVSDVLARQPKTTLDFIVIGHRTSTQMARYAENLAKAFPNQVSLQQVNEGSVAAALKKIAAQRTGQPMVVPGYKILPPQP